MQNKRYIYVPNSYASMHLTNVYFGSSEHVHIAENR